MVHHFVIDDQIALMQGKSQYKNQYRGDGIQAYATVQDGYTWVQNEPLPNEWIEKRVPSLDA